MRINRKCSTKDFSGGTCEGENRPRLLRNESALELLLENRALPGAKLNFLETLFISKKTCTPAFIYYVNKSGNLMARDMSEVPIDKILSLFSGKFKSSEINE